MDLGLEQGFEEIVQRAACAERLLLLLDFDGTLAPIVPHPDRARIHERSREALQRLSASPRVAVGIVSARALSDVRERVGLPDLIYAGNHGWEIEGPGLRLNAEPPPLEPVLAALRPYIAVCPGAWIEDKGLTATIHVRNVLANLREGLQRKVREVVEQSPGHRWRDAIEAIEVIPCGAWDAGDWNKGSAALWIRREIGWDDARVLFAGDDSSDEDAFQALSGEITVKVGAPPTKARYTVRGPDQLAILLLSLAGMLASTARQ